jgi:hypothetical protein
MWVEPNRGTEHSFRVGGQTVAGFAPSRERLSYLPFSGSVLFPIDNDALAAAT